LHIQKIHRLLHAAVAARAAENLSMGAANNLAEEFAATAGMRHRRPLHANMPPMHATPTLTWWCCCGKAQATKEHQMMACTRAGQGRAEQHSSTSVLHAMSITVWIQECRMVMWHSCVVF
jgi:hypothetical protein